ncbi:MAG: choice-of-anchor D domain-containing protein [Verrucomicrobiae bacterium]|nr:choice-of-anchor D domain-containing protein [Verrucomicrobiae bacterium]MCP5549853.1 choice-of-anchor D domain-containing protein [Akkermansiaceae bacterium]
MTLRFLRLLASLSVIQAGISVSYGFSGSGSGSSSDPYVITNASQLQEMANQLSAHYVLGNDIDASGTITWNDGAGFQPIGNESNKFTGSLDGQGYSIQNLTINRPTESAALFGAADGATFENVTFERGTITGLSAGALVSFAENNTSISNVNSSATVCGYSGCGGVAGLVYSTEILNCHCSGDVTMKADGWKAGGLVGFVSALTGRPISKVIDCSATGHVSQGETSTSEVGGLIGFAARAQITRSFATGSVSGDEDVGGLIGRIIWDSFPVIEECYATGTVFGTDDVGGFIGEAYDATITNCFATGSVISEKDGAGFIGYARDCTITACYAAGLIRRWSENIFSKLRGFIASQIDSTIVNCYWDLDSSGQISSSGSETGKTHAEMLDPSNFDSSDWDFANKWAQSSSDSYPHLRSLPPTSSITLSLQVSGHGRIVMTDLDGTQITDFDHNTGTVDIAWQSLKPFRLSAQGGEFEGWEGDGLPIEVGGSFNDVTLCVALGSNLTAGFSIGLPEISVTYQGNALTDGSSIIDLGDIPVGQPKSITLVIENDGTGDLANLGVTKSGLHANAVATSTLTTTTLAPGESTSLEVTYTPVLLTGGSRSASLQIASSDTDENPFDIGLSCAVVVPEIVVEQPEGTNLTDGSAAVDFGSVDSGSDGMLAFTIRNTGTSPLTGLAVSIDGADAAQFAAGALGVTVIDPGESTTFDVTFHPNAGGPNEATLHISSNDPDENPFDIGLSGVGITPEIEMTLNGNDLTDGSANADFGVVLSSEGSKDLTFTIRNTGDAPLTGLSVSFTGPHAADFSAGSLGTSLAPSASASLTVTFTPSAFGDRTSLLHIASSDLDENPFDISLRGTSIERTSLHGWGESFGLAGDALLPTADDDGDSISLLAEYAFNLDPTVADFAVLASGTGTGGLPLIGLAGSGADRHLQTEFVRRRGDPNLIYTVEYGSEPSEPLPDGFAPADQPETVTGIDLEFDRVTVDDSRTVGTDPRRFGRVKVEYAEETP